MTNFLFIIGKLPSCKMNFLEPNTFIYIPFPKQDKFRFIEKFNKMIPVISIFNSQILRYFEIIRFLVNLGFIFYCEKNSDKVNYSIHILIYLVQSVKRNYLKLFCSHIENVDKYLHLFFMITLL